MKNTLLTAALLCTAALSPLRANIDLGNKSSGTPYDRYMSPVKSVLSKIEGDEDSMRHVRKLMSVGRSFRYSFDRPYTATLPEVTQRTRTGDCKDKALWLINAMNDSSVRFVIGKAKSNSKISHAWVMWENEGHWWILDCTNRRDPIRADRVGRNSYIPLYSYAKNGSYQHMGLTRYASTGRSSEAVADAGSNRR